MSVVATAPARPYTARDLDAMPDDGRRYEILDGELLVTPSPSWGHQITAFALADLLNRARSPDVRVLTAPFDVQFSDLTVLEPDVLVVRYADRPASGRYQATPLLVAEVLSRGTRSRDRRLKRAAYERHGVPAYWIVDPDRDRPAVTILEQHAGRYVEVAALHGEEVYEATSPFRATVSPAALVADQ